MELADSRSETDLEITDSEPRNVHLRSNKDRGRVFSTLLRQPADFWPRHSGEARENPAIVSPMKLILENDVQPEIRQAALATWSVGESLAVVTCELPLKNTPHKVYPQFRLVDCFLVNLDESMRQASFLLLYRPEL